MTKDTLVLMDEPEEGYCENFGWVTTDVPVDEAARLLSDCCLDEGGVAGYVPQGQPKRVWLRSNGRDDEGERWFKSEQSDPDAREFYEFDVTA